MSEMPSQVDQQLERLEQLVREARAMPLSASVVVGRDELVGAVEALREAMPVELREARRLLADREELIAEAEREAGRIREEAARERMRMVSETEVVAEARRQAERVEDRAHEEARRMRHEAEDFIDGRLASFEITLAETLELIRRGRERLGGAAAADQLAGPDDEPIDPLAADEPAAEHGVEPADGPEPDEGAAGPELYDYEAREDR